MTSFRCYARRRLGPFRGLVHTLEGELGRAQTLNGLVWFIEVAADRQRTGWSFLDGKQWERTFLPYAYWSPTEGELRRLPLDPRLKPDAVHEYAAELKQALLEAQDRFPFPEDDHLELWLLDAEDHAPLALIASAAETDEPRPRNSGRWSAFRFQEEPPCEMPCADAETPARLAYTVEQAVNRRGRGVTQWFRRRADGGGSGLDGRLLPKGLEGRILPAEAFPPMLLEECWPDAASAARIRAYLNRLAPRLLTLQSLADGPRQHIEQAAWDHYLLVRYLQRLFPRVLDREGLKVALVKAQLTESA